MPSTAGLLVAWAMCLSSISMATPVDEVTNNLVKREAWNPGSSKCPDNNGTIYTGPSGNRYRVRCGLDDNQGYLSGVRQPDNVNFEGCMKTCGSYPTQCHRVVFTGSDVNKPGPCYLKSSNSAPTTKVDGHKMADKL